MTPEEIQTFDQARAVFAQYDVTIEKATDPKLWLVGGVQRLDKGGVIQEARALLARKAQQGAQTRPAPDRRWSSPAQAGNNALVPLREIRTDGGTQSRTRLDPAKVAEYAEALEQGARFPPIVLFYDGSSYWLADGFHRVASYRQVGAGPDYAIPADVRQGTRRDAVLHACGANATHGLPRSTEDKENAVLTLLRDPDWGQWSNREIGRRCNVSHDFVGKVAERHGLTGRASSEKSYVTKHGTTATINTAGIAAANAARVQAEPTPDPQPGEIHPLIAAVMEPEPTRPTEPTQPQTVAGMPMTPTVIGLPVGLLTTGWKISPPSGSSAFFVAHNAERGVSTHGFVDLGQATSAAEQAQELIDDIEAQGWTIQRDPADPRRLRATHPRYTTITGAASLAALHRLIPAMTDHPTPAPEIGSTAAPPAIGTMTTTASDTDIGDHLTALEQQGWRWHGATYTADGWVHLVASQSHPDLARQRLPVSGIANLLHMLAHDTTPAAPPAVSTTATTPADTDLGDLLAGVEQQGWQWDGARMTADGWEHLLTHTTTQELAILTRAGIADLLTSTDPTSTRMVLDELVTPQPERPAPIVPQVLVLAVQPNPYQVPEREILDVLYHTAEMIAGRRGDNTTGKRRQERVYCLPNEEATQRVEAALTRYQDTLSAIAEQLRALGTYQTRLAEAGGIEHAPNPLTPTVISAPDPDSYHAPSFDHKLEVPRAARSVVLNHTPQMLRIEHSTATISGQQGYFVCPDDASWAQLEHLRAAATEAHADLIAVLDELGTYQQALADGRYGQPAAPTPPARPIWPDLYTQTDVIRRQIAQRSQAGVIRATLELLRLVAGPAQIVLPPYPAQDVDALVDEIRVVLEQGIAGDAPAVARLLRAIGRAGAGEGRSDAG